MKEKRTGAVSKQNSIAFKTHIILSGFSALTIIGTVVYLTIIHQIPFHELLSFSLLLYCFIVILAGTCFAWIINTMNSSEIILQNQAKKLKKIEGEKKTIDQKSPLSEKILEKIPKEFPVLKNLDLSAMLLPAQETAGDFYDFHQKNKNEFMFYISDVTGKGLDAIITTLSINSFFHALAKEKKPFEIIKNINLILKEKTSASTYMAFLLMIWDEEARKLQYMNAGYNPVIHFHAQTKKVTVHSGKSFVLGLKNDIEENIHLEDVKLEKDDVIVIYSDGILTSTKGQKENYGLPRFKRAIAEYSDLPSAIAIRNALVADVKEFAGKSEQKDDIALIVCKF